ncbi:hypothetical protein PYCC9005_001391 [Savitreella phatthalungensis]
MVKGSCLCGETTYEYNGIPQAVVTCHCLPCRKSSGTPSSYNMMIPDDDFNFKSSKPLATWSRKGDSGKQLTYNYCPTCHNLIFAQAEAIPGVKILKAGTLDDADALNDGKPQQEIYCRNMLSWEQPIDGAKQAQAAE